MEDGASLTLEERLKQLLSDATDAKPRRTPTQPSPMQGARSKAARKKALQRFWSEGEHRKSDSDEEYDFGTVSWRPRESVSEQTSKLYRADTAPLEETPASPEAPAPAPAPVPAVDINSTPQDTAEPIVSTTQPIPSQQQPRQQKFLRGAFQAPEPLDQLASDMSMHFETPDYVLRRSGAGSMDNLEWADYKRERGSWHEGPYPPLRPKYRDPSLSIDIVAALDRIRTAIDRAIRYDAPRPKDANSVNAFWLHVPPIDDDFDWAALPVAFRSTEHRFKVHLPQELCRIALRYMEEAVREKVNLRVRTALIGNRWWRTDEVRLLCIKRDGYIEGIPTPITSTRGPDLKPLVRSLLDTAVANGETAVAFAVPDEPKTGMSATDIYEMTKELGLVNVSAHPTPTPDRSGISQLWPSYKSHVGPFTTSYGICWDDIRPDR